MLRRFHLVPERVRYGGICCRYNSMQPHQIRNSTPATPFRKSWIRDHSPLLFVYVDAKGMASTSLVGRYDICHVLLTSCLPVMSCDVRSFVTVRLSS